MGITALCSTMTIYATHLTLGTAFDAVIEGVGPAPDQKDPCVKDQGYDSEGERRDAMIDKNTAQGHSDRPGKHPGKSGELGHFARISSKIASERTDQRIWNKPGN